MGGQSFNIDDLTLTRNVTAVTYDFLSMIPEACFVEHSQSTPNEISEINLFQSFHVSNSIALMEYI